jgi:hypothetical protein
VRQCAGQLCCRAVREAMADDEVLMGGFDRHRAGRPEAVATEDQRNQYGMGSFVCPRQASMAQPCADGGNYLAQIGRSAIAAARERAANPRPSPRYAAVALSTTNDIGPSAGVCGDPEDRGSCIHRVIPRGSTLAPKPLSRDGGQRDVSEDTSPLISMSLWLLVTTRLLIPWSTRKRRQAAGAGSGAMAVASSPGETATTGIQGPPVSLCRPPLRTDELKTDAMRQRDSR